jgi:hypothetical protein
MLCWAFISIFFLSLSLFGIKQLSATTAERMSVGAIIPTPATGVVL